VADNITSREQRLRKQAELQSLYTTLANLRAREASYMEASAGLPDVLVSQIDETRQEIGQLEEELAILTGQDSEAQARQLYRQAFEAEQAGEFSEAIKLYKSAGRHGHADAGAAGRSARYREKWAKRKSAVTMWLPASGHRSKNRLWIGLAIILLLGAVAAVLALSGRPPAEPRQVMAVAPTATPLPSPTAQVVFTDTPTPVLTNTPTRTPLPTNPPPQSDSASEEEPTETPTPEPSPAPTLMPAPKIIEPKNGLVWGDGAIVFEFEELNLAYDELYCVNTMRGYNINLAENWSHPPRGNKEPYIPVEPNVFRVARAQGVACIVWSAAIGKGSCDTIISQSTEERIIGLPRPCDFSKK